MITEKNFRVRLFEKSETDSVFEDRRKNTSRKEAQSTEAQMAKRIRELEHQVTYLEQENDFLKKSLEKNHITCYNWYSLQGGGEIPQPAVSSPRAGTQDSRASAEPGSDSGADGIVRMEEADPRFLSCPEGLSISREENK